jgi:DNA polymerase III subunit delta
MSSGVKSLEISSVLRNRPMAQLYLVVGEEDYLRDHAVAAITNAVFGKDAETGFNCDLFYGDENDAEEVLNCAMEIPVFAPRRVVIVKAADKFSAREGEKFLSYFASPHESTTIVFATAKLDGRLKWSQALTRQAVVVDCAPLGDAQMFGWIRQEAKFLGLSLQDEAVQLLKDSSTGLLYTVRRELEKLSAYVTSGRPVTVEDVEVLKGTGPGASVFDLTLAIGSRDHGRALTILARNLETGEAPLRILGALVWQYRRLWKVKDLLRQGGREAEAARILRMDPYKVSAFLAQFSHQHLTQSFALFWKVDSNLKGGSSGLGKRVLEELLFELCDRPQSQGQPDGGPFSGGAKNPLGSKRLSNVRTVKTVRNVNR